MMEYKGGLWMFTLQYEYLMHVRGLGKIHKIQKVSHVREINPTKFMKEKKNKELVSQRLWAAD